MASLEARARRSYELGRLAAGLRAAWPVSLLVGAALLTRGATATIVATGAALYLLATGFVWWGGAAARAVRPSLLAAVIPLLLPVLVVIALTGDACARCAIGDLTWYLYFGACVGGGIAAGALVGLRAARLPKGRLPFLGAAGVLVSVGGSLGCALLGGVGVLGMLGGLAFGSLPALVQRGAHS